MINPVTMKDWQLFIPEIFMQEISGNKENNRSRENIFLASFRKSRFLMFSEQILEKKVEFCHSESFRKSDSLIYFENLRSVLAFVKSPNVQIEPKSK